MELVLEMLTTERIFLFIRTERSRSKIVSEDWISDYHNRYEQAREAWKEKVLEEAKKVDNPFDAYAENPLQCRWDVRWQRKISVKQMW